MRKLFVGASLIFASLVLSGCGVFYPNWGATALPEEPAVTIETNQEAEPSAEPEASEEPTASATPEETETSEPVVNQLPVDVVILIAEAYSDTGMLEVVAQVPGITESSGTCTMRFIGSDIEKTVKVSAQSASDYTQCFPIEFPLSELPSGSGIVTVKYESEFHLGTSAANSVVIP
jgi:hypothetical protein|tara:strand:- start:392 stop:919 length:528 start_codon:yes stop_codon:yes gene_type:complete